MDIPLTISAPQLTNRLIEAHDVTVHHETVQGRRHEAGLNF